MKVVQLPSSDYTDGVLLRIGQRLDARYEVLSPISQGGFAEVYRVRHLQLDVVRALKLLRVPSDDQHRRLLFEGRQLARLTHPNLLQVVDTIPHRHGVGLIMPLITGPTLHHHLRAGPPALSDALSLGTGILLGVAYAHAAGLIHRDLKPPNVLLSGQAGAWTPLVADFGLARFARDGQQTRAGIAMGTPGYMPPEQYTNAAGVDHRADIFALGCILYELLSGERAFRGDPLEALFRIRQREFTPLAAAAPHAPRSLTELVEAAMAPEPSQRPPSVLAMLAAWAPGPPCELPPVPRLERGDAIPETLLPPSTEDEFALWSGDHPELEQLLDPAPEVKVHLESCVSCRVSLKAYRHDQRLFESERLPAPHNLSQPGDPFVGREVERDVLIELLGSSRLVTLLGPGGVGKTRLAIETGQAVLSQYRGGVWLCGLASAGSRDDVLAAVAAPLGLATEPNLEEAIRQSLTSRGPVLLIVDNTEQVAEPVATLVSDWLRASTELTVLVTSQEPLHLRSEQRLRLTPLAPSHATRLFVERARAVRPTLDLTPDTPEVCAIAALLDGLPLALELAAARVELYTPSQLLDHLSKRFAVLRSRSRDLPPRHRTLWATLEWSWSLLEPWEQAALSQLSVFPETASHAAAEQVVDLSTHPEAPWIADVLMTLVERGLVSVTQRQRLRLLNSVRQFATHKLDAASRLRAETSHAAFFATLAEPIQPWHLFQRSEIEALRPEVKNLEVAALRSRAAGASDRAWACMLLAVNLTHRFGPYAEALSLLEAFAHDAPPDPNKHVAYLTFQARLHFILQRHGAFDETLEKLLSLDLSDAPAALGIPVLSTQMTHCSIHDDAEAAVALIEQLLTLSRAEGLEGHTGQALFNLGAHYVGLGDRDTAERLFRSSRDTLERAGPDYLLARPLVGLAQLALQRGDLAAAKVQIEAAVSATDGLDPRLEAVLRSQAAQLQLQLGDLEAAREHLRESVDFLRTTGLSDQLACLAPDLADVERLLGAPRRARQVLTATQHCAVLPRDAARYQLSRAWVDLADSDLASAREHLAALPPSDHPVKTARAHCAWAILEARSGAPDQARAHLQAALTPVEATDALLEREREVARATLADIP